MSEFESRWSIHTSHDQVNRVYRDPTRDDFVFVLSLHNSELQKLTQQYTDSVQALTTLYISALPPPEQTNLVHPAGATNVNRTQRPVNRPWNHVYSSEKPVRYLSVEDICSRVCMFAMDLAGGLRTLSCKLYKSVNTLLVFPLVDLYFERLRVLGFVIDQSTTGTRNAV